MAASSKILDLRALLAERYPQPASTAAAYIPTGVAPLDQALGGGLAKGAITELTSPYPSAGSALVIAALLHRAQQERHFLALIDGCDSFDPQPLGNACLRHLLWLRCTKTLDAVKTADLLLRDGNFPIVILDLVLNSADEVRKIPQTSWYRLQRLAETVPTAFLIMTRRSMISSAQSKLVLKNTWSLADLKRDAPVERLNFEIKRAHGGLQQRAETG